MDEINHFEDQIYKKSIKIKLIRWQQKMNKKPTILSNITKSLQTKANELIPEKVHEVITASIKHMVYAVLTGSEYTTPKPVIRLSFKEREEKVIEKLNTYRKTAAAEGAGTGAGGILLSLADFPLLLSIKIKFLYQVASIYGFDVRDYRERLYILYLFQLAYSSDRKRTELYRKIKDWDEEVNKLPIELSELNWRELQQEYRDYMDLAKMFQMLPGIGAVVGAYTNYRLLDKLGETAINGYRMRLLNRE